MTKAFKRMLASTLGMPCWQVRWDGNVGLDLNFGQPRLIIREPRAQRPGTPRVNAVLARRGAYLQGTHWLVCEPGRWRLTVGQDNPVRDTASSRLLDLAVARLRGEMLVAVGVQPLAGLTRFHFDLGSSIEVRRRARAALAQEEELWSLTARSRCAIVHGTGWVAVEPVVGPPADAQPLSPEWIVVARDLAAERRMLKALRRAAS
jgi:hypothetical protein